MGEQRPFYEEDNWVKISLAIPFKYNPGTHFVYNNVGPYLAGILVQRRFGCDLVSYLTSRLFFQTWDKTPYMGDCSTKQLWRRRIIPNPF